jgi:hypothetical protein
MEAGRDGSPGGDYESDRMKVLLETQLLDSDPNESDYDRFTSLA